MRVSLKLKNACNSPETHKNNRQSSTSRISPMKRCIKIGTLAGFLSGIIVFLRLRHGFVVGMQQPPRLPWQLGPIPSHLRHRRRRIHLDRTNRSRSPARLIPLNPRLKNAVIPATSVIPAQAGIQMGRATVVIDSNLVLVKRRPC